MFLNELNGVIVENLHTSAYIHLSRHCSLFCGLVIHFKRKQPDSFLLHSILHPLTVFKVHRSSDASFLQEETSWQNEELPFLLQVAKCFTYLTFKYEQHNKKVLLLIRCRTHHERMFELIKSLQKQNLFQNISVFIWYSECIFEQQWFVSYFTDILQSRNLFYNSWIVCLSYKYHW